MLSAKDLKDLLLDNLAIAQLFVDDPEPKSNNVLIYLSVGKTTVELHRLVQNDHIIWKHEKSTLALKPLVETLEKLYQEQLVNQ